MAVLLCSASLWLRRPRFLGSGLFGGTATKLERRHLRRIGYLDQFTVAQNRLLWELSRIVFHELGASVCDVEWHFPLQNVPAVFPIKPNLYGVPTCLGKGTSNRGAIH